MKRRSQRLQVVLDMEDRQEQAARERFQAAQQALAEQQQRLDELERYHEEYQHQIRAEASGTTSAARLQAGQQFISQLVAAIAQQQQQVDRYRATAEEAREQWQAARQRREGMARYIETCRRREAREDERREQKALDEAANQRFARAMQRQG
ncbi:flagellar export protein FliJ [Halovibrio salipaludis]|uniref:Flagellar FliJ protein n=1 Tax=Halovibrio salipaludis TaxID=2032626 RepID=A0A2A2F9W6_9GAMM|nr:flagellar export protein FliJ [Halovibrio salipaludis]PAU81412.1 flagellar export protein FliJ [Halovibrio salipaludis]